MNLHQWTWLFIFRSYDGRPRHNGAQRGINWIEEQDKDPDIKRVKELLSRGVKPNSKEESSKVSLYLREWKRLIVHKGVLYRESMSGGEKVRQLVLPGKFHDMVIVYMMTWDTREEIEPIGLYNRDFSGLRCIVM